MNKPPKVFISYSWSNPKHEERVINLAERLRSDGVDVIIDKWDLKEGQDVFNFMESMVKSDEIKKVLIILDKKYAEKADKRKGGVGTETQIISPEIYGNVSQEKFVPIIFEKYEDSKIYIPTYLKGRFYIDLSNPNHFEENYEKLLRNLFERPAYRKPSIGKPPRYLFEDTPLSRKTSIMVRSFDNQIINNPNRINSIIKEFLNEFYEELKKFTINNKSRNNELGKLIYDNILSYTPLRDDYIQFLDKLLKSELEFDIEIIIKFFEKLPLLKKPIDDRSSWNPNEFDNYKFIIHELFLYTILIGLKNENYKFISELFYSGFFFKDKYLNSNEAKRFDVLYNYVSSFDDFYKKTYSRNFYSPMADLIIKRIPENIKISELVSADLLIHYIAVLENLKWFPITYIYDTNNQPELFIRLKSKRHFEKVKILFDVNSINDFKEKIEKVKENANNSNSFGYSQAIERVIPIYYQINIEEIGTIR